MDVVFGLLKAEVTLCIPLIITAVPLVLLAFLTQLKASSQSVWLTGLSAIASTAIGLVTPFVGTFICMGILASNMPDDHPKCVTGAVMFIPVGYFFTGLTLLIGIGLTVNVLLKQDRAGYHSQ